MSLIQELTRKKEYLEFSKYANKQNQIDTLQREI